ncbi:hypothetical protein PVAP13_2KG275268 [Panicum virgatum]|uniref:Uncharacterized protein n=1 Tax=Panicum virgatum TaxID=38727 RepID=A0A8T0W9G0_PANVG|nr:hypothetical protein PVAP13_2KG275268 [Panicum virgatum]
MAFLLNTRRAVTMHKPQSRRPPPSVLLRCSRARSLAGVHLSRRRRAVRSLRPCHDLGHAKGSGHALPPVKAEPCLAHAREHKPSTASLARRVAAKRPHALADPCAQLACLVPTNPCVDASCRPKQAREPCSVTLHHHASLLHVVARAHVLPCAR